MWEGDCVYQVWGYYLIGVDSWRPSVCSGQAAVLLLEEIWQMNRGGGGEGLRVNSRFTSGSQHSPICFPGLSLRIRTLQRCCQLWEAAQHLTKPHRTRRQAKGEAEAIVGLHLGGVCVHAHVYISARCAITCICLLYLSVCAQIWVMHCITSNYGS